MSLTLYSGPDNRKAERRKTTHVYPDGRASLAVQQVCTIECVLRRQPGTVVEVPRGLQLQVTYGGDGDSPNSVELSQSFGGYAAKVKSGSDWVLVQTDGVIVVDARVTIQFAPDAASRRPSVLMDMTLKGTIDLKDTFRGLATSGPDAFEKFRAGTFEPALKDGDGSYHWMVGSARFEGGEGAVDSDYAKHFADSAQFGKRAELALLVREQFFTTAKIYIQKVPNYDPIKINVFLWSWQP